MNSEFYMGLFFLGVTTLTICVVYYLIRYCGGGFLDRNAMASAQVVQSQETRDLINRRNQRRQEFHRFVSSYNRNFTPNSQRHQEFETLEPVIIDVERLRENDCPPSYEDALGQDKKIEEKPPEYLELYI